MDDDFPFSWHLTREGWEKEQREWAEFNRKFEEEMRAEEIGCGDETARPGREAAASPWQQSGSHADPQTDPPLIVLFGLACHVAELEQDMKTLPEAAELVGSVNRHFGNRRNVVDERSPELIEPVVERFSEQLQAVSEAQPELSDKRVDLQRQSRELAARLSEWYDLDEDVPF